MVEQVFAGRSLSTQKLDDFRKSLRNLYMNGAKSHRKSEKLLSFSDWQVRAFRRALQPASQPANQPASSLQRAFQRGRQLWLVCSGWLALGGHTET